MQHLQFTHWAHNKHAQSAAMLHHWQTPYNAHLHIKCNTSKYSLLEGAVACFDGSAALDPEEPVHKN